VKAMLIDRLVQALVDQSFVELNRVVCIIAKQTELLLWVSIGNNGVPKHLSYPSELRKTDRRTKIPKHEIRFDVIVTK
jgi:hypothetical protein